MGHLEVDVVVMVDIFRGKHLVYALYYTLVKLIIFCEIFNFVINL